MPRSFLLIIVFFIMLTMNARAQRKVVKVMFYNVENLFDVMDDSLTNDDEYTPNGDKGWNNERLYKKLKGIYKVIMAASGGEPPQLLGLAEVENSDVLDLLIYSTPLRLFDYRYMHHDSDDERGIDVALLYRKEFFYPVFHNNIDIRFPFDSSLKTRNILHVKGRFEDSVFLDVFVNHWPSRYGGLNATEQKRTHAALTLHNYLDSLFCNENKHEENILIMGDFNDEPQDNSLKILTDKKKNETFKCPMLYNLFIENMPEQTGTIKYQANWFVFDQLIVSESLLNGDNGLIVERDAEIFAPDFLLIEDERNMGKKTYRTYIGPRYIGGFSDHLPVLVNLNFVGE